MYSKQAFGPITAVYYLFDEILSLTLVPTDMADQIVPSKLELPDPLVQVSKACDGSSLPYSGGLTLHNSMSAVELRLMDQTVEQDSGNMVVSTRLKGTDGEIYTHRLWGSDRGYLHCSVTVEAVSPITLHSLPSFSINGLTPFSEGQASDALRIHRFSSYWSAEGRHECYSLEELNMEPSWSKWAPKVQRIYQLGTMPVRGYFPFLAVEDVREQVIWAAELEWNGSWQMEVFRQKDNVVLTGGLADYDVGHWSKTLQAGESLTTPDVVLTCVRGDIDHACETLLRAQEDVLEVVNEQEDRLCLLYNEYCDTWSNPTKESIQAELNSLSGLPLDYFVIDAGWYGSRESWHECTGDWYANPDKFPHGMGEVADLIKSHGFKPGIWFEAEVASVKSDCFAQHPEWFVTRNGQPIQQSQRVFLDLCREDVKQFLHENVIGFLKDNGFSYIKIDYNDHAGLGFDGYESLGESIRCLGLASYGFFDDMRRTLPELVIENCSSGGHRLEPGMMKRASMASFSDAHECVDIPLIAADLQRLILPRQSQIWAVIRKDDSERRIAYSMTNMLLGRGCLSGNVAQLNADQMDAVRRGLEFYVKAAPVIKHGSSRCVRESVTSYNQPKGTQTVIRISEDGTQMLLVCHAFDVGEGPYTITLHHPLFVGMRLDSLYGEIGTQVTVQDDTLSVQTNGSFSGVGILMKKQ